MRPGIRLQLLLALAGLLLLAFFPLFFAVAGLTRSTLQSSRDSAARSLGRAVAAHVSEARSARSDATLEPLLQAEVGYAGLAAIAVYDPHGSLVAQAKEPAASTLLPPHVPVEMERIRTTETSEGRALEVLVPSPRGPVLALVRTDDETMRVRPLVQLVALYTAVFGAALLLFTYMVLTRLIVRPIDRLVSAASRVSAGASSLDLPRMGAREIVELGQSFAEMTRLLRSEEQALRQKVQELERMTRELKTAQKTLIRSEKLASVGKLSAGLAHEIGNPIAAIIGFQELLLSGGLDPDEQRDFLERMKKETERIHNILRQLLDFARPASIHPGPITQQVGAVSEAIQDACGLIRPQRSSRDIAIVEDVEKNLPLIHMSREKLTQVLVNLLLNATDAIGGKGHVWLRARQHEGLIRIEVEDDGPGIPDEVGESIFEPFVTTKEVGDGTGLGLAVCRGLIDAAEGSIAFEKGKKGGAKAVILLPVVKQDLT